MATSKELANNSLQVGTLLKNFETIFQYAGGKEFHVIKSNSEFMKMGIGNNTISSEHIDYLYNAYYLEFTTAFDCEIASNSLPLPEPIDVTGWMVNKKGERKQIDKIVDDKSFAEKFFTQVKYSVIFKDGSIEDECDVRPCLPPSEVQGQSTWMPKEGEIVWHIKGSEKVKIHFHMDGKMFATDEMNRFFNCEINEIQLYQNQDNQD